jgi:CheY-specific phosphatase CheX
MPENHAESVLEVFCQVLESLAFMFGEPASPGETQPVQEPCLEADIAFHGPQQGSLKLLAPASVAAELSANVLGLEPGDEAALEQARDALGELMNVTLGQLLTTVAGETPVFDLLPPRVEDADPTRWTQLAGDDGAVAVQIDGKPVLLKFTMKS